MNAYKTRSQKQNDGYYAGSNVSYNNRVYVPRPDDKEFNRDVLKLYCSRDDAELISELDSEFKKEVYSSRECADDDLYSIKSQKRFLETLISKSGLRSSEIRGKELESSVNKLSLGVRTYSPTMERSKPLDKLRQSPIVMSNKPHVVKSVVVLGRNGISGEKNVV